MITFNQLIENPDKYTWQLYVYNHTGSPLDKNLPNKEINKIRYVKSISATGITFAESFLDLIEYEITFHEYLYNKEDVILNINKSPLQLSYHLRLIK